MILVAGGAAREVLAYPRQTRVGVRSRQLQLDVLVQRLEALLAGDVRAFMPASSSTNLYAQVVKRLAPRNVSSFARIGTRASSAACVARSLISSRDTSASDARRRASSWRAPRISSSCSWTSAGSRTAGEPRSAPTRPVAVGGDGGEQRHQRRVRDRNSWRVRWSSRNRPWSAEVTVRAPVFWTPRSDMHMCSASSTTPTPRGAR